MQPTHALDGPLSPARRNYVLAVLTLVYAVNFIDRQLVVILQESIRHELGLSDTQLGLLSGLAFALFYVTCGIPIARWSESRERRSVIAGAVALWSLMTALCGLAQNFAQLLLARMGVGVGESGSSPPSHSMISDMYPPRQRGTALSVYSTGVNLGILAGLLLGGWINEFFGWRTAFVVLGLPGLAIALLVRLTVSEPPRGHFDDPAATVPTPSVMAALGMLSRDRTFVWLALGCALQAFGMYGIGNWFASFIIRAHGTGTGELGTWLALSVGVVGGAGSVIGGIVADRLGRRDRRWYFRVPLFGGLLGAPFVLCALLARDLAPALLANAVGLFFLYAYLGPNIAMAHALVGPHMRALTSAILFFVLNLIGMGLGPLFTGFMSDALAASFGPDALRYALCCTLAIATAGASLFYLLAARSLRPEPGAA